MERRPAARVRTEKIFPGKRFRAGCLGLCVVFSWAGLAYPSLAGPLREYLSVEDPAFRWSVRERVSDRKSTRVTLDVTSQVWRGQPWRHQLVVVFPRPLDDPETALLLIAGGRADAATGEPNWLSPDRPEIRLIRRAAQEAGAPAAVLFQVPRQPLFDGLYEDAAVSRTFQDFLAGAPADSLLLFPMVRSAVRAMDAVQAVAAREEAVQVRNFLVSGASKRGWTAWLTGASDPRVRAIAPMAIDMLNWDRHFDHQVFTFGGPSAKIHDYTEKGLHRMIHTEGGRALVRLVDPFSYRARFTLPVQILLGTNDPYWPVDSVKFYQNDLPSDSVLLHYTPNAGHDLGDRRSSSKALTAFFRATVRGDAYPRIQETVSRGPDGIRLRVRTGPGAGSARLWSARSDTRDFRRSVWTSHPLALRGREPQWNALIPRPPSGYLAFYAEVSFTDPGGNEFPVCTRAFVSDSTGRVDSCAGFANTNGRPGMRSRPPRRPSASGR